MFQKGYRGGTVEKPLDERYKLIINELRFYDIHSELLGNASLQKREQVWHCWSELQKRSVKKLSFECTLNTKIIAGIIRIRDFLWQLPSYSLFLSWCNYLKITVVWIQFCGLFQCICWLCIQW